MAHPVPDEPKQDDEPRRPGRLRWLFGWIVMPGLIIAALFLSGVHVGARHPGMWLSRAVLWAFNGEAQLGPTTAEDRQSLGLRVWRLAVPSKEHSLHMVLTSEQVEAYAAQAKLDAKQMDCKQLCEQIFRSDLPNKELLEVTSCVMADAKHDPTQGKLDCDARLQR